MTDRVYCMKLNVTSAIKFSLSLVAAMMVYGTDYDNDVRFVIPCSIVSLLLMVAGLYYSDFGLSCGNYIISKRSYYKKKKKKPVAVQSSPGCFSTNAELSQLPSEYIVICNYHKQTLKMDNLVIGPSGIYVIDSNNIHGAIDKVLSVLMLNENLSMDGCVQSLKEKAMVVRGLVTAHTPLVKALKPVLCFTDARVNLMANEQADGVLVVSLKNLPANIVKAPLLLEPSDIRTASALIMNGAEYASCRTGEQASG